jgi:heme exporter protein D
MAPNLAYACMSCNRSKGPNVGGIGHSGQMVRLYNPRFDTWADHFRMQGARIQALTEVGATTVRVLKLNSVDRVLERKVLLQSGRYPSS